MRILFISKDRIKPLKIGETIEVVPRSVLTTKHYFKGLEFDMVVIESEAIDRPDLSNNDPLRHTIDRNIDDIRLMTVRNTDTPLTRINIV